MAMEVRMDVVAAELPIYALVEIPTLLSLSWLVEEEVVEKKLVDTVVKMDKTVPKMEILIPEGLVGLKVQEE